MTVTGDTTNTTTATLSWDGGAIVARWGRSTLLCGDRRGVAGATTTMTMGGPGNVDVKVVDRFARAGRL
jgi:hypothetical protein